MKNTKKLTTLGLLGALSIIMVTLIHFPLFAAAPFLEYDPADIPIFISAFLFGPLAGFALTVAVSIVQGITVSASGGYIGIVMHILSTGAFVLVAGNIYKRKKTRKSAAIALGVGVIVMTLAMTGCNMVLTPIFMNVPRSEVIKLIPPVILPFNLVKSGVNAIVTMLVYKHVSNFVHR